MIGPETYILVVVFCLSFFYKPGFVKFYCGNPLGRCNLHKIHICFTAVSGICGFPLFMEASPGLLVYGSQSRAACLWKPVQGCLFMEASPGLLVYGSQSRAACL